MGVSGDIVGVGLPPIIGGEIACQPMDHLGISLIAGGRHDGAGIQPTANTDIVEDLVTCPYVCSWVPSTAEKLVPPNEKIYRHDMTAMAAGGPACRSSLMLRMNRHPNKKRG